MFIDITKQTEVNQDAKVRRHRDGSNKEFYVIGWNEEFNRYKLKEVITYMEKAGIEFWTSSDDLIANFQIEVDSEHE